MAKFCMDHDIQQALCAAAFHQWQEEHPVEAKEAGFEDVQPSESSLTFTAKGMKFQLLFPSTLFQDDFQQDQTLIAMNLDNLAPSSLKLALNEKLERIRLGPTALEQGLDVFAKALISFGGKRRRAQTERAECESKMGSSHTVSLGSSIYQANSIFNDESEEDSDTDCWSGDEMEYNKGTLHAVVSEASERCEAARNRSVESFLCTEAKTSFCGPSAMDDILQFCNFSTFPKEYLVKIEVEVTGVVNDLKMASCLGLPCSKQIHILLEFDRLFWTEKGLEIPLEVKRVNVSLDSSKSLSFLADVDTKFEQTLGMESDEEFSEERRKVLGNHKTDTYSTSVLLPELIKTFLRYRSEKSVVYYHSKPWVNRYLNDALEYFSKVENPLIGLICFVGTQMRALPSWCAICWSQLPACVGRLRTCQNDLCLFEFEELGMGATIHHEVKESPEVIELEMTLACAAAASTRDVFEPFPSFFLTSKESRGRSGWFAKSSRKKEPVRTDVVVNNSGGWVSPWVMKTLAGSADPGSTIALDAVPNRRLMKTLEAGKDDPKDPKEMKNKKLSFLLEILQSIPKLAVLQDCVDEISLRKKLSKAYITEWRKQRPEGQKWDRLLSYDLMRFVLSTNRLSLRIIKGDEELKLGIKPTFQFVVLHESPEKEAIFEEARAQRGSFFAFHGSGLENWYSILRNGLRAMSSTKYQSSGAAHGPGIYLAERFSTSFQYSKPHPHAGWRNGVIKNGAIVAICEVINDSTTKESLPVTKTASYHGIHVVPPGSEDLVSVRYILVMDSLAEAPANRSGAHIASPLSIKGSMLQDPEGDAELIDLRVKYKRLRQEDQIQQQKFLLDRRMETFKGIKRTVTDLQIIDDVVFESLPTPAITEFRPAPAVTESSFRLASSSTFLEVRKPAESSTLRLASASTFLQVRDNAGPSSLRFADYNTGQDSHILPPTMPNSKRLKETNKIENLGVSSTTTSTTATATQAITKEFRNAQREISKSKHGKGSELFLANITIEIPNETDLYVWHVNLAQNLFKSYPNLYKDLQQMATLKQQEETSVLLEVNFSGMYPFEPPFIRVVRPRFHFHTGHVTIGGSICMELLTSTGWLPSFSFESVLVQIVNAFVEGEGRIDMKAIGQDYSRQEAEKAFTRVADQHGWKVNRRK